MSEKERTKDSKLKIDISGLEKDLRGIVYKVIYEELQKFEVHKFVAKYIKEYMENHGKKLVKDYVYAFMDESEIVQPDTFRDKKVSLNEFMIRVIRESLISKINDYNVKIEKKEGNE